MRFTTLFFTFALLGLAQSPRIVIRSTGQYSPDGTATYGVFLASGSDVLESLTVTSAVPAGARFLEAVHTPQDGAFEGVRDNIAYWRVARLDPDTLLGPFVIRVKPDGSGTPLPQTMQAAVHVQSPSPELVESPAAGGRLVPLSPSGSIAVDTRGTLDAQGVNTAVEIGSTGVFLFVPEGAVSQRVVLSIRRLAVEDGNLPSTEPATWWCGIYEMTSEPRVAFTKPVSIALTARRPVAQGVPIRMFTSGDLRLWQPTAQSLKIDERGIGLGGGGGFGGGFGFGSGGCNPVPLGGIGCGFGGGFGFGGFGAFGYVEQDNLRSKVTGAQLNAPATTFLQSPPSIGSILTGVR